MIEQSQTLDQLLAEPANALVISAEVVPSLLAEINKRVASLDTLRMVLAARLAAIGHPAAVSLAAEPERDVTQKVAAEQTGIPLRTIRWLTRTRRIASFNRNRMVRVSDVRALIDTARTQGVAIVKLPEVAWGHDARGGQDRTPQARPDAVRVRRARRRPAQHGLEVGGRDADGGNDGRHPDPPPRSTGAQAPKEG